MLALGGLARDEDEGRVRIEQAIASGAAAERFACMAAALGGPGDIVERPEAHLPTAPIRRVVEPGTAGFVTAIDTRALGVAVIALGGGRTRADQAIDHAVGLSDIAAIGQEVGAGRPLAVVQARSDETARAVAEAVRAACRIGAARPEAAPTIADRIEAR